MRRLTLGAVSAPQVFINLLILKALPGQPAEVEEGVVAAVAGPQ